MTEKKLEGKWYDSRANVVITTAGIGLTILSGGTIYGCHLTHLADKAEMERLIAEQTAYQCRETVEELAEKSEKGEKITRYGIERLLQQKNCGVPEE